jgi:hypothetical protein
MNIIETVKVFMLVCSVFCFCIGFHNLDLAWNMDSGCLDTALDGTTTRSQNEIYQLSVKQLFLAFIFSVLIFFIPNIRATKPLNFQIWNN